MQSDSATLENSYYRVTLDPETGAIQSIFDKELNRELVDASSPYKFNQYIYVTGADKPRNTALEYKPTLPKPVLEPHGASGGHLISVVKTPFGTVANHGKLQRQYASHRKPKSFCWMAKRRSKSSIM